MNSEFGRIEVVAKTGHEMFHDNGTSMGFDLLGFWRWSVSDLVSNATRGRLAEYIIAKALGINTDGVRNEWDAFDLVTPSKVKVEVKSAAFLQSWSQKKLSPISFNVPKTRFWDADTNIQADEAKRHADVYVFALLAHTDKSTIDPTDLSQWRFYVLPTSILNARTRSQHSISLRSLEQLTRAVPFCDIAGAVEAAAQENAATRSI